MLTTISRFIESVAISIILPLAFTLIIVFTLKENYMMLGYSIGILVSALLIPIAYSGVRYTANRKWDAVYKNLDEGLDKTPNFNVTISTMVEDKAVALDETERLIALITSDGIDTHYYEDLNGVSLFINDGQIAETTKTGQDRMIAHLPITSKDKVTLRLSFMKGFKSKDFDLVWENTNRLLNLSDMRDELSFANIWYKRVSEIIATNKKRWEDKQ